MDLTSTWHRRFSGRVMGGHVAHGCIVHTTAEVLLLLLSDWSFDRELDPVTGFAESSYLVEVQVPPNPGVNTDTRRRSFARAEVAGYLVR